MPQNEIKTNEQSSVKKWAMLAGGAGLIVLAVACGLYLRGGGDPRPDPKAQARQASKKLTEQVRAMMADGKFDAAAGAIGGFLDKYPDTEGLSRFWAFKIVCHRKTGDLTGALMTLAGLAEKFNGRGAELFDAGVILLRGECYPDAAKLFELASSDASLRDRACYQAAICNYRIGRFAKAMKFIDIVAAIRPNDPKVRAAAKQIEDARFVDDTEQHPTTNKKHPTSK